jgi:hypothetical protein
MGMFQPAVLPTAVWQDFFPFREFQVIAAFDLLVTATARYPCKADDRRAGLNLQEAWPMNPTQANIGREASPGNNIPQIIGHYLVDQSCPISKEN